MSQKSMIFQSRVIKRLYYLLHLPKDYSNKKKWPLIISLHGAGERGSDTALLKRFGIQKRLSSDDTLPFIVVCPQCPENSIWEMQFDLLTELIEHIQKEFAIDDKRLFLTGYSMGGYGTWNYAMLNPSKFAAIVPVSGGAMIAKSAKFLKDVRIWIFHGAMDKSVPIEESQKLVDILKANNANIKFTIYPDAGHEVCTTAYENDELYEWLLDQ